MCSVLSYSLVCVCIQNVIQKKIQAQKGKGTYIQKQYSYTNKIVLARDEKKSQHSGGVMKQFHPIYKS